MATDSSFNNNNNNNNHDDDKESTTTTAVVVRAASRALSPLRCYSPHNNHNKFYPFDPYNNNNRLFSSPSTPSPTTRLHTKKIILKKAIMVQLKKTMTISPNKRRQQRAKKLLMEQEEEQQRKEMEQDDQDTIGCCLLDPDVLSVSSDISNITGFTFASEQEQQTAVLRKTSSLMCGGTALLLQQDDSSSLLTPPTDIYVEKDKETPSGELTDVSSSSLSTTGGEMSSSGEAANKPTFVKGGWVGALPCFTGSGTSDTEDESSSSSSLSPSSLALVASVRKLEQHQHESNKKGSKLSLLLKRKSKVVLMRLLTAGVAMVTLHQLTSSECYSGDGGGTAIDQIMNAQGEETISSVLLNVFTEENMRSILEDPGSLLE
eukprot:CAMPEP_0194029362 /NCGR_PEP_ID=MMETSP0009_2-20130614/3097_1 /TAXON_ID=210454 /ORGANISM="Grammatophora oceanica, Strain CCMP 410" /LENGTH=375 /DNA_ID=CAMNT_0038668993 /DNA_START=58 /DNA_END=1185 /DNA_ORIENTATION=+